MTGRSRASDYRIQKAGSPRALARSRLGYWPWRLQCRMDPLSQRDDEPRESP